MKTGLVLLLLVILAAFGSLTLAQEVGQVTISDVTGNSPEYYGQTVTLEGVITELVNVRTFVISDQNLIDNQLLVINNTGREFDLRVTGDQRVVVTGIVRPHYAEGGLSQINTAMAGIDAPGVNDPAMQPTQDPAMADPTVDPAQDPLVDPTQDPALVDPAADPTQDPALVDPTPVPLDDTTGMGTGQFQMDAINLASMILPDRLHQHTILELISIQDLIFVDEFNQ